MRSKRYCVLCVVERYIAAITLSLSMGLSPSDIDECVRDVGDI